MKSHALSWAALLLLLVTGCATTGTGRSEGANKLVIKKAIDNVFPGLVRIYVIMAHPRNGRMARVSGAGSGAIISADGYVVTNHHVAGNATRIVCTLANDEREEIEAELVGTDPMVDIAVLKLNLEKRKNNSPLTVVKWGDSDAVRVGDTVLALGSPGALSQSVTKGIVSNVNMILPKGLKEWFKLDGEQVGTVVRWIAHDAQIFGGNSGGPLVNTDGEIIGINEIGLAGLGGAIPSNLARKATEDIIKHGRVQRSWSGLELQPRLKKQRDQRGALVAGVIKDSPAAKAGLKAGDLLVRVNDQAIDAKTGEEIPPSNYQLMSMPAGTPGKLTVVRDGKELVRTITPEKWQRALPTPSELKNWGIVCRDITKMMALTRSLKSQDGVLILSTRRGRAAAEAKPRLMDEDIIVSVNGKPVKNITELKKVTDASTSGKDKVELLVEFERKSARLLSVVPISRKPRRNKAATAKKAWLPVSTQVLTRKLGTALSIAGTKGVRITKIFEKLAGDGFPLKVGDLVLNVDGDRIDAQQEEDDTVFQTMVEAYRVGNQVSLGILRGGKKKTVKVKLMSTPKSIAELKTYEDETFEFSARNMRKLDDPEQKRRGVIITSVENAGWASLAGLRPSDVLLSVDSAAVASVATLKQALAESKEQKPERIVFFIRRGVQTRHLELEPQWK